MDRIGIFCSTSPSIDPLYFEKCAELGTWLGKSGKTLIYGGASLGLMECISKSVSENDGKVIGVVPDKLEERGKVSTCLTEVFYTTNLSERKDIIVRESDILIALPGGIGTYDEVFHVMAAASIGYHTKQIVFYNINGFYNKLIVALEDLGEKGFLHHPLSFYYQIANTLEELQQIIESND
ncbi:MAG: TIGR00730 family Rossman fold protein [Bacteroides sp.]|nr:TIGR00730 family Rossman fold protein [Bacteroides sp.]